MTVRRASADIAGPDLDPIPSMVTPADKPHFGYIDSVRGYAVLMVMTGHYAYLFPNLPYPVHRVAVMGWYGVQLFFIASSLTLLMSWHFEERTRGTVDRRAFFIRRYFRIAPAYYCAGAVYFVLRPPIGGFDPLQALATATFVNSWHPALLPTVPGRWTVVPGGWSISVEFMFYMLFPWFADWIRTLPRVALFIAATVMIGVVADRLALHWLARSWSAAGVNNFLFFWFPNEINAFGFGALVFLALRYRGPEHFSASLIALIAVLGFLALAFVPLGHFLGDRPLIPVSLAVCPPLALFVFAMARLRSGLLVNRFAMAMGKVSFSAYLLHFIVLDGLRHFPGLIGADASGYRAIGAFALVWPVAAMLTFITAAAFHYAVEKPGMAAGKALIRRGRRVVPVSAG